MNDKRIIIEAVRGGYTVHYPPLCCSHAVCTTVAELHAFVDEIFGEAELVAQAAPNEEVDHGTT